MKFQWNPIQTSVAKSDRLSRKGNVAWYLPVESFEMHDRPAVRAEAPAVPREELDVRAEDDGLTFFMGREPDTDDESGALTSSFSMPTKLRAAKRLSPKIKAV